MRHERTRLFPASHIAIANNGHLDGGLHACNHVPIGASRIELRRRAAMHRNRRSAGIFHTACEIDRDVFVCGIPLAEFDRCGMFDGGRHLAHDLGSELGRRHERRAVALLHDLASRAAHVDVDISERIAHLGFNPRGFTRHRLGLVAEQLHGNLAFVGRAIEQVARFLVRERKRFAGNHFGIRDVAAQLQAQLTEGDVVHASHGGKKHGNGAACAVLFRGERFTRSSARVGSH